MSGFRAELILFLIVWLGLMDFGAFPGHWGSYFNDLLANLEDADGAI